MSIIPCRKNEQLQKKIADYIEVLKVQAHTLGDHGLSEQEFYSAGIFRGAIESIRGNFSASMSSKRDFVARILNYMQDENHILEWVSAGDANRHDYRITMPCGRVAVIELKGCLDGNNTNIFERPANAHEFIIWSVCTNPASDPQHNVWSGIHTRLGAEIIENHKLVDGLIVWDMACGTAARPCPKLEDNNCPSTVVGPFKLPPPCIYLFPGTIPQPRNNPNPKSHALAEVSFLHAFSKCFGSSPASANSVSFEVNYRGNDMVRTTRVYRDAVLVRSSKATPIKRK